MRRRPEQSNPHGRSWCRQDRSGGRLCPGHCLRRGTAKPARGAPSRSRYMPDAGRRLNEGEFEQRLRSVIDQVQSSPIPIILFIDEAHTLIGAGDRPGRGTAQTCLSQPWRAGHSRRLLRQLGPSTANISKGPGSNPPLPAGPVGEPTSRKRVICCAAFLRLCSHIMACALATQRLLRRSTSRAPHIPARQLPDKAVSLLDTACARVAISQTSVPAAIEDARATIRARESEASRSRRRPRSRPRQLGRITELDARSRTCKSDLADSKRPGPVRLRW